MRALTYRQLVRAKACDDQRALFRKRYGDHVSVTVETAREAAQFFDWDWAVDMLLSPAAQAAYNTAIALARGTYRAAIAPALGAYVAARDSAWAAYVAACGSAWDEYRAAVASARDARDAAVAPAQAAYRAAQAEAFALAYISDAPIPTSETTTGSILAT